MELPYVKVVVALSSSYLTDPDIWGKTSSEMLRPVC